MLKNQRRSLCLVFAAVALFALALPSFAQTDDRLLAEATSGLVEAATYEFEFVLSLGLDGPGPAPLVVDLRGAGTMARLDSGPALALEIGGLSEASLSNPLQVRVVDGIFYMRDGQRPWSGAALAEILPILEDAVISSYRLGFEGVRPGASLRDLPFGSTADPQVRDALVALKAAVSALDWQRFSRTDRLADDVLGSEPVAHFTTAVALDEMFGAADGANLMLSLMQLGDPDSPESFTGAELNAVARLAGQVFKDVSVRVDRFVGLADGGLRRAIVEADLSFEGTTVGLQQGEYRLRLDADVSFDRINDDLGVERPENAMILSNLANMLGLPVSRASGSEESTDSLVLEPQAQGDTPADAEPLTASVPVEVVLTSGEPLELVYSAPAGDTISVYARSLEEPGTLDTTLEVLSPSGIRLTYNDDTAGDRDNLAATDSSIEDLELPGAGDYIIRVDTYTGAAEGRVEVLVESDSAAVPVTPIGQPNIVVAPPVGDEAVRVIESTVPRDGSASETFSGSEGQTVTITVRADDRSDLDPKVVLYGPTGTPLADNDDHDDDDPTLGPYDSRIDRFTLPSTGDYTVEVSGFAGSGGDFELTIDFSGAGAVTTDPVVTQDGDREVIAGTVESGGVFTHVVEARRGDVMTISAIRTGGDLDPELRIYDSSETLLSGSDDHGTSDRDLDVLDSRLENFIFPSSGSYYIDIYGIGDSSGGVDLVLERVAQGAPTVSPVEQVEVGEIAAGGSYTTTFDARAGDYVTITVRGLNVDMDPRVTLYDAGGTLLADNDDHGMIDRRLALFDSRIENYRITQDGTYTVEVRGYQSSAGSFGITISTLR